MDKYSKLLVLLQLSLLMDIKYKDFPKNINKFQNDARGRIRGFKSMSERYCMNNTTQVYAPKISHILKFLMNY